MHTYPRSLLTQTKTKTPWWKNGNSIPAGLGSSHLLRSHGYHVWFILFFVCETSKLTFIYGLWVKNLHFSLLDLPVKTMYWHKPFFYIKYQISCPSCPSWKEKVRVYIYNSYWGCFTEWRAYMVTSCRDFVDSELCRELLERLKLKCNNKIIKSASHGTPPWWVALSASNFSPDCVRAPVIQRHLQILVTN